ncbi:hypothetical protein ACFV0R_21980, partial [Streptomyces sp. NPDC059578]
MCCALAALLGVLVHTSVTHQTVGQARERALTRLGDATRAFEDGDLLGPGAAVDPPDLPRSLRRLALDGERGTMVGDRSRAAPPAGAGAPRHPPGVRGGGGSNVAA